MRPVFEVCNVRRVIFGIKSFLAQPECEINFLASSCLPLKIIRYLRVYYFETDSVQAFYGFAW